jgi:hypothetical protein
MCYSAYHIESSACWWYPLCDRLLTAPVFPSLYFLFRHARDGIFETYRNTPACRLSGVLMCQRSCRAGTAIQDSSCRLSEDGLFTFDWLFCSIFTYTVDIFFRSCLACQEIPPLFWSFNPLKHKHYLLQYTAHCILLSQCTCFLWLWE